MPDWPSATQTELAETRAQLRAEQDTNLLLQEAFADLELMFEDRGWQRLTATTEQQFTRHGLAEAAKVCRVQAVANPLIKRALDLRTAYVWGRGISVTGRATGGTNGGQDINAVVQAFWDDESVQQVLTGAEAQTRLDRVLGTDGNWHFALFSNPRTGRVQPRFVLFEEIVDVITNPDDTTEHWYYHRQWTSTTGERSEVLYPALGYRPRQRPRMFEDIEIWWDAPMLQVKVNDLEGWKFGIGDAYAALVFARGYKDFLEDWAKLVKALSRFAWRATANRRSKAVNAATQAATAPTTSATGQALDVGAFASLGPGQTLEAIPKTGATIDSESGRPLAAMVAAALGVPVTMLLGDPGTVGARATAETLDKPTEYTLMLRRRIIEAAFRRILNHVIDMAVKAPAGPLQGTVRWDPDTGREVIELADETDRTIDIAWPDLTEDSVKDRVAAVVAADGPGVIPPLVMLRKLLEALDIADVDEILDDVTDEYGNFVPPDMTAGQALVDQFNKGQGPGVPGGA